MTIELPIPSAGLISQLETATIEASQNEAAAVRAIRERFACYAKHNGFIQTADFSMQASNYRVNREAYFHRGGRKLRGLLCYENYTTTNDDQNRGGYCGWHLYLTETGDWLKVRRVGHWTRWQGEAQYWYTDQESARVIEVDPQDMDDYSYGDVRTLTDEQVAEKCGLNGLLTDLGKAMAEMCKKLPERYGKLKARAELAQRVLTATQEVK